MSGSSLGRILVEGHGDKEAVANLVTRLWNDLDLPSLPWSSPAIRWPKLNTPTGIRKACERMRVDSTCALLITRDEDDLCPRETGPETARWVRAARLPFPVAVTFFHREYEVLFLPCMGQLAGRQLEAGGIGREGIAEGTVFGGDPEALRDVKGWITKHLPKGTAYKETIDQVLMTRMLDFPTLRRSRLPCFGTLERGLKFLAEHLGEASAVYPPEL